MTVKDLYETVAAYIGRPEFRRWQDNPEEPREWAGAAAFLGSTERTRGGPGRPGRGGPGRRCRRRWTGARAGGGVPDPRGSGQGGTPIHVRDLSDLLDFLQALTYRFPEHLERKAGKGKKRFSE